MRFVSAQFCAQTRDHNGQALAYVYFEDEPGREQHPTLTLAEASRGNVALGVLRGRGLP
jgi:hypothetical protein